MKIPKKKILITICLLFQLYAQGQQRKKNKVLAVESNLVGTIQFEHEQPKSLRERMIYHKVRGLSIAVIKNYKIIWAKGYGWADSSQKRRVTSTTVFQAASVSKSLNALGLMKLAQDKKVNLFVDVNTYLKSWKLTYNTISNDKTVTIANLLSHTGGINVHGYDGYERGNSLPSIVQILNGETPANSKKVSIVAEPGKSVDYSGGGISISQLIVMDVTNQPYADFMKKYILLPLGMTHSSYMQPPNFTNTTSLATGYDENGKEISGKYNIYPELAAAGLWTTPTDLAKYVIGVQLAYHHKLHQVLNANTAKLMLTPDLNEEAGLGVFITKNDGVRYFTHDGDNSGFKSQYYGSLEGGNGVVIMVNSDNSEIIQELANSVAKVYGFKGMLFNVVKKVLKVNSSVLDSYVGNYKITADFGLSLTKEGNQLYFQGPGRQKIPIYAETQTSFFPKKFLAEIKFVSDSTGKITSLMINQSGQKTVARKVL